MDQVYRGSRLVSFVSILGKKLVGTAGGSFHLRRVHHQEDTLAVVERRRGTRAFRDELGRRTGVRTGGCVLHQPVCVSELRHSIVLFREIIAHWRLSFREQGELRTAHSANAIDNAAYPTHASHHQHEELHRVSALGLSTGERSG